MHHYLMRCDKTNDKRWAGWLLNVSALGYLSYLKLPRTDTTVTSPIGCYLYNIPA